MMATKGLILRRYIAENSKNVNTSQNKTSIFMILLGKTANQHREAVLKFQETRYVILTLFSLIIVSSIESLIMIP